MDLLHDCCSKAKEAIEHCVCLPQDDGYQKAIDILHSQLGKLHEVAKSSTKVSIPGENITRWDIARLRNVSS